MMYYVYILRSLKDKKIYVGYTSSLKERIKYHNSGKVVSTKNRKPLELIYYEAFRDQKDATNREKFYKTGWGRNHLKKILTSYFKGE